MPQRRGSFHEDVATILKRFAHQGPPPAARAEQRRDSGTDKEQRKRRPLDFHQQLFDGSKD